MMADWLRLWHGTVTDTKFLWVARRSAARFGDVMTVWMALLEEASQQKKRGDVTGFDVAQCARLLGIDPDAIQAILQAMEGRFIKDGRVIEHPRRPIFVQAPDGRLPIPERPALCLELLRALMWPVRIWLAWWGIQKDLGIWRAA